MIKVRLQKIARVCQGDILRDVDIVETVEQHGDEIRITKIEFPLVIVLSQDCDLEQDYGVRWSRARAASADKKLFSVLVAPLYNAEHVYVGDHLSHLNMKMQSISKNKTPGSSLRNNETPRYHYLEFPENIQLPPLVIDFKHFFCVPITFLKALKSDKFVCKVAELYREQMSHRFASFLARIGLP